MTTTLRQSTIVIKEIRLPLEFDDARPVGYTITWDLVDNSLESPNTRDAVAHHVSNLFGIDISV